MKTYNYSIKHLCCFPCDPSLFPNRQRVHFVSVAVFTHTEEENGIWLPLHHHPSFKLWHVRSASEKCFNLPKARFLEGCFAALMPLQRKCLISSLSSELFQSLSGGACCKTWEQHAVFWRNISKLALNGHSVFFMSSRERAQTLGSSIWKIALSIWLKI